MNQVIIPEFTCTNEKIAPTFVVQAPMWLPQHRDSTTKSLLVGWFQSSVDVPCDPTLALTALHMSSLL
jgi:hypothetical protein